MKRIIPILIAVLMLVTVAFVACDKTNGYIADNTEHYDDITKTLKLGKVWQDRKLMTDGISEVQIVQYTDGDTLTVSFTGGQTVIRFYGVDTPESTVQVEKLGKSESNFTKDKLKNADKIFV